MYSKLKYQISSLYFIVIACVSILISADIKSEVERHLEMGKKFLSKGQFADALTHYHLAIELDPKNYMSYYRRATVLLATGKMKAALPDLDKVVELKPDFISALVQRGNILLKQGKFDESETDYKKALVSEPNNAEVQKQINKLIALREYVSLADTYLDQGNYQLAEDYLDKALEDCLWDPDLHRKRAQCRQSRGDIQNAIADIRAVAKLVPDSTGAYLEMSQMYYSVGDAENSLAQVRECLKLNPDHKECFPFYKKVKKLAKLREDLHNAANKKNWMACLENGKKILKYEQNIENVQLDVFRITCKCNMKAGHVTEAIQECSEVLKYDDENDLDILCDRAEAYIENEQFEKAIEDYQKAINAHEGSQRAKEGLSRAQKLEKQAKKKDYYKILGVRRNANKKEIMKAYRKLAQQWHPDNFHDDNEKAKAQDKFLDIAAAKEVLTDPKKRQRFDQGEDPLDPQAQQQSDFHQGFNPFGHGFNPFGSDGGSFKFHFG